MHQSLADIASLAESLGCRYYEDGIVNLSRIARSKKIPFVNGTYGDYFIGQLVYHNKGFCIVLNEDVLSDAESGRRRFTIAHELGHYFIDHHRNKLSRGVSLSRGEGLTEEEYKRVEIEANHFAAHLLMPEKKFKRVHGKLEQGFAAIYHLKDHFDTSIECTTKHYINLDLAPSIMIRWRRDFSFHYAPISNSFSKLTGIKRYHPIRFDPSYVQRQVALLNSSRWDYIETATPLSRWVSSISSGAKNDLMGLEQSVQLGNYGGITLLTFSK
jgi:Zn-dependent peptidase ImmA (M78 family)